MNAETNRMISGGGGDTEERWIAFDVETPNHRNDRISSIGISVIERGRIVDSYATLVNPECEFDDFNIELTGIRPEAVMDAPNFPALWERIEPLMSSGTLVAHNAVFDLGVLKKCLADYRISWKEQVRYLCTVQIGRKLLPKRSHKLNALCEYYGIELNHHRADSDSQACAEILLRYMKSGDEWRAFYQSYAMSGGSFLRDPQPRERFQNSQPSKTADENPRFAEVACLVRESQPQERLQEKTQASPVITIDQARSVLSEIYGHQDFRPGQERIIEALMQGRDALCVMPTGSGKSLCYQIPALMKQGTAIVISPLISLMKDQVAALRGRGIPAAFLNSAMTWQEITDTIYRAAGGGYRILYVAPERLLTPRFSGLCRSLKVSLIAVDEAHCISQWGQDFRPSYLKIRQFIESLPERPPVGAFTATATRQVRSDILTHLQLRDPEQVTTGYDRPNLSFSVYEPKDREETLLSLLRERFHQSGIVYCGTRKNVESICDRLEQEGFPATRYHAGLPAEERIRNQEDFLFDRKRVMVATNAFGMGIDKSNVSYVIHFNMPQSLEAYYQEAGRAGRDGCEADCILLYAPQDVMLNRWMIQNREPNPELSAEEQREIQEKDEERLKQMTFYSKSQRCLRRFILQYFGETAPEECGNCSNCVPDCLHVDVTRESQMILSSVVRTGQRLPAEPTAALLMGVCPDDLPEDIDPGNLTTFGIMKEMSREKIETLMGELLKQGYLEEETEEPHALKLTQTSRTVLFEKRRVLMKSVATQQKDMDDEHLFAALQQLRYQISAEEYIAASALFSDATLRDICRMKPTDKMSLARADGMGTFKAIRYGDRILRVVSKYQSQETGTASRPRTGRQSSGKPASSGEKPKTSAKKPAPSVDKPKTFIEFKERVIAEGHTDAYQPWTTAEDQRLTEEFRKNVPMAEIAKAHRRTRGAILHRLRKLELV